MSETPIYQKLSPENQTSFDILLRSLNFSKGEFSLLLPICNYGLLQQAIINRLQDEATQKLKILKLPTRIDSLYSTIKADIASCSPPSALMVLGLEQVQDIDEIFAATNLVREEFRKHFHFPIWIWINDRLQQKLIRQAPDIESWATPIPFYGEPDLLKTFLTQISDSFFEQVKIEDNPIVTWREVDKNRLLKQELEAAIADLKSRKIDLEPNLEASVTFTLGEIVLGSEGINATGLKHYESSLHYWERLDNPIRKGIVLMQLGQWWQGEALQRKEQEEKEKALVQSQDYLQKSISIFKEKQCLDLEAKCVCALERVLHQLEKWDELEPTAERGLALTSKNLAALDPELQPKVYRRYCLQRAQNYRFLADVALAKTMAEEAENQAEEALKVLDQLLQNLDSDIEADQDNSFNSLLSYERSATYFSLARALLILKKTEAGLEQLETARQVGNPQYDPQLYIQILRQLQAIHFKQKNYLLAFKIKQQYRSIERQYGIRAFIGAGRLESQKIALRPGLTTTQKIQVSQEIAASGRQQDVERLIERMGRPDCKLTVIYGQSGVGKSSLVQAGFIPAISPQVIDARRITVVLQQLYTDWMTGLSQGLQKSLKSLDSSDSNQNSPLLATVDNIIETLQQNSRRDLLTVLVFDQFEEFFFVYKDLSQRKIFYDFLKACLDIPFVKVVLSLREDYLHYLLECNRLENLEAINNNILDKNILYHLGNFSKKDTKHVIESLIKQTAVYLQADLIDVLVDELAGQLNEVRPIELQIVGAQLQTEKIKTLALYSEKGPKEALVGRYLEDVIKDCGPEQEQIANLVLYLLTDENNTRPLKTRADLELELDVQADKLDLVLQILVSSRLVFLIPAAPTSRYQLVHDYLVEFVRKDQSARMFQELEKERELRKLSEVKLNKALKKQLFTTRISAISLAVLTSVIGAVAAVSAVAALNVYTALNLVQGAEEDGIDALVKYIKAAKTLRKSPWKMDEVKLLTQIAFPNTSFEFNNIKISDYKIATISHNKEFIAALTEEGEILVWDIYGRQILSWSREESTIVDIRFQPNQDSIVFIDSKKSSVEILDIKSEITSQINKVEKSTIFDYHFSPNYDKLVLAYENNFLEFIDLNDISSTQNIHLSVKSIRLQDSESGSQDLESGPVIFETMGDVSKKVWRADGKLLSEENVYNSKIRVNRMFPKYVERYTSSDSNKILLVPQEADKSINYEIALSDKKIRFLISSIPDENYSIATRIPFKKNKQGGEVFIDEGDIISFDNSTRLSVMSSNSDSFDVLPREKVPTFLQSGSKKVVDFRKNFISYLGTSERIVFYDDQLTDANRTIENKFWSSVRFSPNGEFTILYSDKNQAIELLDSKGNPVSSFSEKYISFSSDDSLFALQNFDGDSVELFGKDGNLIEEFKGIDSFELYSNSFIVVKPGKLVLWSEKIGKKEIQLEDSFSYYQFIEDKEIILTVHESDNQTQIRDIEGKLINTLDGKFSYFDQSNSSFVTLVDLNFSDTYQIRIWDERGTLLASIDNGFWSTHAEPPTIRQIPNSNLISISSRELTGIYSKDGNLISVIPVGNSLLFSPNGKVAVSTQKYQQATLWNIREGTVINRVRIDYGEVSSDFWQQQATQFSTDGEFVAVPSGENMYIIDMNGSIVDSFKSNRLIISEKNGIMINASDNYFEILSLDNSIYRKNAFKDLTRIQLSADFEKITAQNSDGMMKIWNIKGDLLKSIAADVVYTHENNNSFIFHKLGTDVVTHDRNKNRSTSFSPGDIDAASLSISPDGKLIAVANIDNSISLWDASGKLIKKFDAHEDSINCVDFSVDGKLIASASDDGEIKVWRTDGTLQYTFDNHQSDVNHVEFSPDGKLIASASNDKTVRLWNLDNGKLIKSLELSYPAKRVKFERQGSILLAITYDQEFDDLDAKAWLVKSTFFKYQGTSVADTDFSFSKSGSEFVAIDVNDDDDIQIISTDLELWLDFACIWARGYLHYSPNVPESERSLCNGIGNGEFMSPWSEILSREQ